jgi:hypothetical protein
MASQTVSLPSALPLLWSKGISQEDRKVIASWFTCQDCLERVQSLINSDTLTYRFILDVDPESSYHHFSADGCNIDFIIREGTIEISDSDSNSCVDYPCEHL